MRALADIPDQPPAALRFRRRAPFLGSVRELWHRRELISTLARRDFIARYKQTLLGVGWSVVQPLLLVLALSLFLGRLTHANTAGKPYVLWSMVGLIPWTFFSAAVTSGMSSLLSNQPLLNKVRCPREVFPIAGVLLAGVDSAISVGTLGVLFVATTTLPAATVYWIPLLVLVQVPAALGVSMLVSILVVYLRDLRNVIPLLLQFGLFVSPIAFGLEQVPSRWRLVYCFLNPVAPVIDSYRRVVLFGEAPAAGPLLVGAASSLLLLLVGFRLFKKLELGIADLI